MALTYNTIIRQAALRLNAVAGPLPADLQTNYLVTPLTTTQVDSADFPLAAFADATLAVESKLANAIASYRDERTRALHPWRRFISGVTANVANRALVPSTDASSNQIIGALGAVRDASDNVVCDEMSLEDVRLAARNSNSWLKTAVYGFCIVGNRIEHTRPNVIIDVCVYNRTTQATAIATLTNSALLPDALEEAYVNGVVSLMFRDDAFVAQAQAARGYLNETLQQLQQGATNFGPVARAA